MRRLWKAIVFLIVLGILAFVGFAYFGDLTPDQEVVTVPIELDEN